MENRYKFLRHINGKIWSANGDCTWKVGAWKRRTGEIELCENGFHCSQKPLDALSYVKGEIIAQVEVAGLSDIGHDKECWQRMKIIHAWHWAKEDSVALAIFAAEKVIGLYEKQYPGDDRPRKAIEAAKAYLENPARAADAARAAAYAAYAAKEKILDEINEWIIARLPSLQEITNGGDIIA